MLGLGFFGWIIIGGLAGWIASKIMGTDAQMGIGMNILVGVAGGFIGGLILRLILCAEPAGKWGSFITCLLGAVLLLWVVGKVKKN